jgi:colanic acid/amylovoran biosynthesis glycosyltransferase
MITPMRVAMFVGCFPLVSETFILRQIVALIQRGHDVDIYSDTRPWDGQAVHRDVNTYGLVTRTTYMDLPPEVAMELPAWPPTGETWLPGATQAIPNARRLLRAIPTVARVAASSPRLTLEALRPSKYGFRAASLSAAHRLAVLSRVRRRYDVLHAQFGTIGDIFRFAKDLWRAPLIVSFRGYDYSRWPREQGRGVYRWLFKAVDAVTVNTEFARRRVEALGCPQGKIRKIPSSIEVSEFAFHERSRRPDERLRLLTVARLVEMKGVEYSIRAVAELARQHVNLQYDIVGDGPLRASLEQLTRHLGVASLITFHGARDLDAVRRMMDQAHVFVLASVTAANGDEEGLGNVLVEAQASGLPVVATEHNGFPETIVPDRSGYLVPERDVQALAARLADVIARADEWPAMGRAGRAHVEGHYDIHTTVQQLEDLYRGVSEAFGRHARRLSAR